MSIAACGGGMGGSDDDNGCGEEKRKDVQESFYSPPPSTDEDTDEADEKEADDQSKGKQRRSSLDCVASLEESLPMKRGLSSSYDGKSKSFVNLSELSIEDSKELGKKEHAINKRRRMIIANEIREKSLRDGASSNMTHSPSLPAFSSDHGKSEDEDEKDNTEDNKEVDDDENEEDGGE